MKVYESHVTVNDGGGMILIAADSRKDATLLAANHSRHDFLYRVYDFHEELYAAEADTNYVSIFAEVPNLVYNGDKPKIILENIYFE